MKRYGEQHPKAKLSDQEVSWVIALREYGLKLHEIAEKMEVSKSCIAGITQGRRRVYYSGRVV